jgi:hypothetical protein
MTPMPAPIRDKLIKVETDKLVTLASSYDNAVALGTAADLGKAQLYRNEIIHLGLILIDDNYNKFENDLFVGRATSNIAGDFAELGLSAATGITNGERVKTILAIAATAFKGGRKSIDMNLFRERSTELIALKMRASRARILDVIYQGLGAPVDKYPLGAALDDLVNYVYAGSLNSALLELSQDAGDDAKSARSDARKSRIRSFLNEQQVVTLRSISDAREELRTQLTSTNPTTVADAVSRIRAILAQLYPAPQIAAATSPAELFNLLQAKIAEATRNRDTDLMNKIQELLSAP